MPKGDQTVLTDCESLTCCPARIAINEGEEGTLETAPDPQRKTMNAVDFNLACRPGMATGKVGTIG